MQYVNFVHDGGDEPTLHTGPVPDGDAAYLRKAATHLKPLSDEEYLTGPACILQTGARYSYVLDGDDLYWCIEWDPGLLVVRMSPGKELQWVALRSPIPDFGGRTPLPEDGDPADYDDADNPQYNLVFTPWDAQFDEDEREAGSFVPADEDVRTRFQHASARVNGLARAVESRDPGDVARWSEQCKRNIEKWCGEGVRLRPTG